MLSPKMHNPIIFSIKFFFKNAIINNKKDVTNVRTRIWTMDISLDWKTKKFRNGAQRPRLCELWVCECRVGIIVLHQPETSKAKLDEAAAEPHRRCCTPLFSFEKRDYRKNYCK